MKKFYFLIVIILLISPLNLFSKLWEIEPVVVNNNYYYPLYKIINILKIERIWDFYSDKFILKNKNSYLVFIPDENNIYLDREIKFLSLPVIRNEGIILVPKEVVEHIFKLSDSGYSYKFIDNEIKVEEIESEIKEEKVVSSNILISPVAKEQEDKNTKDFSLNKNSIKVIVIDPGHGGEDPGAIGQVGLREKDVVLSVSLKLKEILNKKLKNVKIILTRDKDVFVSLKKRAEIANSYVDKDNPGIFISIHCNASYNKNSNGFETYVLSDVATDDEARAVAAMENGIIDLGKGKNDFSTTKIISQLLSAEYIRESLKLAELIQVSYKDSLPQKFENRGVKKALFCVLEGTIMPAVLTEIGFITNKEEEKLLRTQEYQLKIAEALSDGIINFIKWYESNYQLSLLTEP